MYQDLNRRLNLLQLPDDIVACLWYIFQEKNEIFSSRNASRFFKAWLATQGYNFWVKKLNYKFDAHLWSTVFQEKFQEQRLNREFTNLTIISIPCEIEKFKSNYTELCHLSKILQRINEIYFKQTKEFQQKSRLQKLASYVIQRIVFRHLQEKRARRKIDCCLHFPNVLMSIVFDYYFLK